MSCDVNFTVNRIICVKITFTKQGYSLGNRFSTIKKIWGMVLYLDNIRGLFSFEFFEGNSLQWFYVRDFVFVDK